MATTKKNLIVGIDSGKMNLKAKSGKEEMIYANKYSVGHTDATLLGRDTFNVTYLDNEITVGENGSTTMFGEGKDGDFHIISALTSITQFIEPSAKCSEKIIVVYGESIDAYYNEKKKEDIKTKLERKHKIVVNEEEYNFEIEYVHILPEGIGHILSDVMRFTGVQYTVDMGGSTVDYLEFKNGRPSQEKSFSTKLGIHKLVASVILALKRADICDAENQRELIEQYVLYPKTCSRKVIREIIDLAIEEQFNELEQTLISNNINLVEIDKLNDIVFTGGASELFAEVIKKRYVNSIVIKEPVFANVRGFYEYGVSKFGGR